MDALTSLLPSPRRPPGNSLCLWICPLWMLHMSGIKDKEKVKVTQSCPTPLNPMDYTAKSLQLCPTLCDPIGGSPPGSPIPGIFQARVLEWGAIAFSDGLYSPWNSPGQNAGVGSLSLLQGIFPTQGLNPRLPYCRQILYCLSYWLMEFSRQEYWSG